MDYPGKVISKNAVVPSQTSASGVWTLDDAAAAVESNTWPVAGVPNPISRSLRFNSADSTYLNRTPATAGNRRTWTWSGWVKRSALTSAQGIFGAGATNGSNFVMYFESDDALVLFNWTSFVDNFRLKTTQVFRDASAWYHIILAVDTTQATSSNRVKLYLNGSQVTALTTATYPTQNFDSTVNTAAIHTIGARSFDAAIKLNGYMTEINFIDGQALDASYFGMTDPQTGAWIPKKYNGTYGTNGFYLNFSDNASTAALGTDYSGNNNTWTTNNFSVTAGAGNDSMTDVPTPWWPYNTTGDVGGVVRGNYATLNPLTLTYGTLSNGNLNYVGNGTNHDMIVATSGQTTGKWYCEVTLTNAVSADQYSLSGVVNLNSYTPGYSPTYPGGNAASWGYYPDDGGNPGIYNNAARTDTVAAGATNDVIGMALDCDAGTLAWYKNNSLLITKTIGSGNWAFVVGHQSANCNINFGQRPFAYTPPAGFLSLCTTNLPTPTILDGTDYFNTVLYTGNGTSDGNQQAITGVGFSPDLVWLKSRSNATGNYLADQVRGVNKTINSNSTGAEQTQTIFPAFGADGFTVEKQSANDGVNVNGYTYVAWNWKANGAGSTNTAGTITSTVSVNTTSGFSIVTYTGTGSAATVGHGLGVAPAMIIVKSRSQARNWPVYHKNLTSANYYLRLDTTAAQALDANSFTTTPSSTVFSIGTEGDVNSSGATFVAYCFAAIPGYSAMGSFVGNGSTDGPFIFCGFRPRWILIKASSAATNWWVWDTARNTYNVMNAVLYPDLSNAEYSDSSTFLLDTLSNGFKYRTSNSTVNGSGTTYIYAAFAENPFKYSNAR